MARARVKIFCQAIPPEYYTNGGTEELRQIALDLKHRYEGQEFRDTFLVASKIEDRVTGVRAIIVMVDEINHKLDGPWLWVDMELPTNVAGRSEVLTVHHRVFLTDWLDNGAPHAGNFEALRNHVGEVDISADIRFASVHEVHAQSTN